MKPIEMMIDPKNSRHIHSTMKPMPYQQPKNQRLSPEIYATPGRPCFITIRSYLNQSPFVSLEMNRMIIETLNEQSGITPCRIHAYCLMPDHMHMLISPLEHGVSVLRFTEAFKGKTTNRSWQLGWQGKLWQPRYYDHVVRAEEDVNAVIAYILNNPVRKGWVKRPKDWPWCGCIHAF